MICLLIVIEQAIGMNVVYIQRLPDVLFCFAASLASEPVSLAREGSLFPPVLTAIRTATAPPGRITTAGLSNRLAFGGTEVPLKSRGIGWIRRDRAVADRAINDGARITAIVGALDRTKATRFNLTSADAGEGLPAILAPLNLILIVKTSRRALERAVVAIALRLRRINPELITAGFTDAWRTGDITSVGAHPGAVSFLSFFEWLAACFTVHNYSIHEVKAIVK